MNILFATKKLHKIFNSKKELEKNYGLDRATKIQQRLGELTGAECLADMPPFKPARCHELQGKELGLFSVDISSNYRLLFYPSNITTFPRPKEPLLDLKKITEIIIYEVKDTH